ncbi:nitric oxide dioxygenase [Sphingomonas sp. PP-F2F-G114-C0414]|jgi:hemoglobin-like flavoprotein|uniref:globin domain-containing protein n=1 Tax=Sphingomonas sp. PP-F2F-G114-C0414 TaxID=2135662 RepID=UPI000EF8A0BA|nr:globin domain-containing protein [Sphingomonas sp. PP-F2F-G114-C0414]RMB36673.1 nitric oxide dioxygenase [Sphingomonas sp. PP-F2F-G114-C0414]
MSLTADQVRLVTESYVLIGRSPRPYSELFYHRLLLDHPFARALFPDDLRHQAFVFDKTIAILVREVGNIAGLRPTLADLARKHVGYGVRPYQYEAVGAVLIATFSEILGSRFTPEIREAWEAVYAETAGVMIAEAYPDG